MNGISVWAALTLLNRPGRSSSSSSAFKVQSTWKCPACSPACASVSLSVRPSVRQSLSLSVNEFGMPTTSAVPACPALLMFLFLFPVSGLTKLALISASWPNFSSCVPPSLFLPPRHPILFSFTCHNFPGVRHREREISNCFKRTFIKVDVPQNVRNAALKLICCLMSIVSQVPGRTT